MKNLLLTYFLPTLRISRKPTFDLLLSDFDFSAALGPLEGNPPHKTFNRAVGLTLLLRDCTMPTASLDGIPVQRLETNPLSHSSEPDILKTVCVVEFRICSKFTTRSDSLLKMQ